MKVWKLSTTITALFVALCALASAGMTLNTTSLADGGGPVPPRPPVVTSLLLDGGGPVPPRPPAILSGEFDGGGPVPPRPPLG